MISRLDNPSTSQRNSSSAQINKNRDEEIQQKLICINTNLHILKELINEIQQDKLPDFKKQYGGAETNNEISMFTTTNLGKAVNKINNTLSNANQACVKFDKSFDSSKKYSLSYLEQCGNCIDHHIASLYRARTNYLLQNFITKASDTFKSLINRYNGIDTTSVEFKDQLLPKMDEVKKIWITLKMLHVILIMKLIKTSTPMQNSLKNYLIHAVKQYQK